MAVLLEPVKCKGNVKWNWKQSFALCTACCLYQRNRTTSNNL